MMVCYIHGPACSIVDARDAAFGVLSVSQYACVAVHDTLVFDIGCHMPDPPPVPPIRVTINVDDSPLSQLPTLYLPGEDVASLDDEIPPGHVLASL